MWTDVETYRYGQTKGLTLTFFRAFLPYDAGRTLRFTHTHCLDLTCLLDPTTPIPVDPIIRILEKPSIRIGKAVIETGRRARAANRLSSFFSPMAKDTSYRRSGTFNIYILYICVCYLGYVLPLFERSFSLWRSIFHFKNDRKIIGFCVK